MNKIIRKNNVFYIDILTWLKGCGLSKYAKPLNVFLLQSVRVSEFLRKHSGLVQIHSDRQQDDEREGKSCYAACDLPLCRCFLQSIPSLSLLSSAPKGVI